MGTEVPLFLVHDTYKHFYFDNDILYHKGGEPVEIVEINGKQWYIKYKWDNRIILDEVDNINGVVRERTKIKQLKDRLFEPYHGKYGKIVDVFYTVLKSIGFYFEFFSLDNPKKRVNRVLSLCKNLMYDDAFARVEKYVRDYYN
jgi:hypothetical protein